MSLCHFLPLDVKQYSKFENLQEFASTYNSKISCKYQMSIEMSIYTFSQVEALNRKCTDFRMQSLMIILMAKFVICKSGKLQVSKRYNLQFSKHQDLFKSHHCYCKRAITDYSFQPINDQMNMCSKNVNAMHSLYYFWNIFILCKSSVISFY